MGNTNKFNSSRVIDVTFPNFIPTNPPQCQALFTSSYSRFYRSTGYTNKDKMMFANLSRHSIYTLLINVIYLI